MIYQTKILVIEDNQKLGKTIKNVLTMQGYDVCFANNGALGIQKAFEYNPDLILCDIKMDPIDGYQVYNVLKESSIIDQVPFIFITGSSDLQDIRFGLDLGVDDYFVKPFDNETLIKSIEKRLTKYRKLKEIGKREFRALADLSPNGIFLFDGNVIFEANPMLIKKLNLNKEHLTSYSIERLINPNSFLKIKDRINRCINGVLSTFSESVTLLSTDGNEFDVQLYVSAYEKYSAYSLMIGLVVFSNKKSDENEIFRTDVFHLLKRENVVVTESLGEQLNAIFKQHPVGLKKKPNDCFSRRENEVLALSMEGLPIKLIADKLSISDRTVEKHRASMMEKTNSNNMIEVIIFALRNNLIEI
jgi:DNA-binding NarL/FixJ family response regulator